MERNLIITAAVGYRFNQIEFFIKSLRKYYFDDICFIIGNKDIELENGLKKYDCKIVKTKINKHFPESKITICQDKYWANNVNDNAATQDPRVIIRSTSGLTSADHQYISHNKHTVFILSQQKWLAEGKAIGAIDPFHADDSDNKSDVKVFNFIRQWASVTEKKEPCLLHVIHIPPLAIEYEKKIETLHKEQVYRFAKKVKCPIDLVSFTRGTPEHALLTYINDNNIDVIALGCREHSLFDKWLNGSTISALITHQNTDLVLLNTP